MASPSEIPCPGGREPQPPTIGSVARVKRAALSGPRREKGRVISGPRCGKGRVISGPRCGKGRVISGPRCGKGRVLDVIEDLAALSLEFALGDGSALAELVQLTHVRDQVHERRRKSLVQMQVFLTVELWRPGVPRLEIKKCLERRVRDSQGLDAVFLDGHQPHRNAVGGMHQIAVEVALEDLAVLKADCHLLVGTRLLGGGRYSASERNALDRGQRDKGALVIAGLVEHLQLEIGLVQAGAADPALHNLVVKKSDGDGGGFPSPRTAHLWPS